jgi:predicted transcriptional regulator
MSFHEVILQNYIYNNVAFATFQLKKEGKVAKGGPVAGTWTLILQIIANNEPLGIRVPEIADASQLNRVTVYRHCDKLEDDSLIKRKNKQAEWHLTQKGFGYPGLRTFLFYSSTIRKILHNDVSMYRLKFPRSFENEKSLEEFDKKMLSEFANRLSATILYMMIQALNPRKSSSLKIQNMEVDTEINDPYNIQKIGRAWIDSINPDSIFREFSTLLFVIIGFTGRSLYEMDQEDFGMLIKEYSEMYPQIFKELEDIRKNPKDKYLLNIIEDPYHRKCNGKLLPETQTNGEGKEVQLCSKCHRWIEVKKPKTASR